MGDWLIVGAGFAGSVLAERIATQRNERVLLIDRRNHVGGNAYDHLNEAGILIHRYGPHIFHTNSQKIVNYLKNFTGWRPYEHKVLAEVDGKLLPIPINRNTINSVFGLNLETEKEVEFFLRSQAEPISNIMNSRDVVVSQVGTQLYEKFFLGYTRKQWNLDPSQLDKSVAGRIPIRFNTDDRYFSDDFQAMPDRGYTTMFNRMTSHPNIDLQLGVDFNDIKNDHACKMVIFTGPVDEYYGFRFGKLPYRSLKFVHKTLDCEFHQPVAVVNYPQKEEYTRITEYKYLTGQIHDKTSISMEYPSENGDPYYPIPREENKILFRKYDQLARKEMNTFFVGRLATYQYLNMDQVIGQALSTFRRIQTSIPAT